MDSYSSILKRHARMVLDPWRTLPLQKSIEDSVRKGDVVVDVGCGVGLLSFYAAQAGAKRIYAIDCDAESVATAQWLAKKYGWHDRIVWFPDLACNVDLAEKADVLIQETIGSLGFDENFLATLCDAKKRFLKRGGKIIPQQVALWGQLGSAGHPQSKPKCLAKIVSSREEKPFLKIRADFEALKTSKLTEVTIWPKVRWGRAQVTDCSPSSPQTHWGQGSLGVKPCLIQKGHKARLELQFGPHPQDPWARTEMVWRLTSHH